MPELTPAELHCLRAAEGWFELGNVREAEAELSNFPVTVQLHPAVAELRWQIHAKRKQWHECIQIAQTLTRKAPAEPLGWIHLSYALHELKRTQEAWDSLLTVVDDFPKEPTMRYNLACYECLSGNLDEAKRLIAEEIAANPEKKEQVLQDEDLKPIWDFIKLL